MCVIAICEKARPNAAMVKAMWEKNAFGGGVAWRGVGPDGEGEVFWEKGLSLEQMQSFNEVLPFPYVLHFRVPSSGTSMEEGVCHPFPIEDTVSTALSGSIKGAVLFHNGYWNSWKYDIKDVAIRGQRKLPLGAWSDSRALAWMASQLGLGILEFIDEKMCVLPPEGDPLVFKPQDWKKVNDVWVSNDLWVPTKTDERLPTIYRGGNNTTTHKDGAQGGSSNLSPFRAQGAASGTKGHGKDNKEGVQETTEETHEMSYEERKALVNWLTDEIKPREDGKCMACKMEPGSIWEAGKKLCWNCWGADGAAKTGTCSYCYQKRTSCRTVDDHKWICTDCWETEHCPGVYSGGYDD